MLYNLVFLILINSINYMNLNLTLATSQTDWSKDDFTLNFKSISDRIKLHVTFLSSLKSGRI